MEKVLVAVVTVVLSSIFTAEHQESEKAGEIKENTKNSTVSERPEKRDCL